MEIQYTYDENNNEILTDASKHHQVMMEWEKPYMEYCIELLEPSGSVLEIGFGLGYSARKICMNPNVTNYTVIECSPVVWEKYEDFKSQIHAIRPDLNMTLVKGRWQDVLHTCGIFNSVFFDDYDYENNVRRFDFFLKSILENHSIIGTRISCYSTVNTTKKHNSISFFQCDVHSYKITIPEHCKYAKGDTMYIPVITKTSSYDQTEYDRVFSTQNNSMSEEQKRERINKIESYIYSHKDIQINNLIIDNFYSSPNETRDMLMREKFTYNSVFDCEVTRSFLTEDVKHILDKYIKTTLSSNKGQQICNVKWSNNEINGCYMRLKCTNNWKILDLTTVTSVKSSDNENTWMGILFMSPYGPLSSGIGVYSFQDGTRSTKESKIRENTNVLQAYSSDVSKWHLLDKYCGIFNRLVLLKASQFVSFIDNFGIGTEDSNLIQFFIFETN